MNKISTREEFLERYNGSLYELYQSKKDILPFQEDAKNIINLIFNFPSEDIKTDLKCIDLLSKDEFFIEFEKEFINKLLFSLFRILSELNFFEQDDVWQQYFSCWSHTLFLRYSENNSITPNDFKILTQYFFGTGQSYYVFEQNEEDCILKVFQKNVSFENGQAFVFGHTFKKNWDFNEFLFIAAACGKTKILHYYKNKITSNMLPILLHNAFDNYKSSIKINTVIYLLEEYGVENIQLTPELAKDIETLTCLVHTLNKIK